MQALKKEIKISLKIFYKKNGITGFRVEKYY